MNNQIVAAAESILRMWKGIIDESNGDVWHKQGQRQGYQDSLNAMIYYGLISDYDVVSCKASTINRVDKSKMKFVPHKIKGDK